PLAGGAPRRAPPALPPFSPTPRRLLSCPPCRPVSPGRGVPTVPNEPIVVTCCTPDYARPWIFPSLGMLRNSWSLCLLHPDDDRPLPFGALRVACDLGGYEYQDGRFLDAVPALTDDDVVVLADADGIFQRDFSADELATLTDLRDGFALGYNVRPGQRGEEE